MYHYYISGGKIGSEKAARVWKQKKKKISLETMNEGTNERMNECQIIVINVTTTAQCDQKKLPNVY